MKVLRTILRAFIVGIGVGILVAPRAGNETRRMLSERLNGVLEGANGLADKLDQPAGSGNVTGSSQSRSVGGDDAITM
jgi:gas vesicle protein